MKSGRHGPLFPRNLFFCDFIPNQKHRFVSKKRCLPRRLPYQKHRFCRCPVWRSRPTRIQAFSSRAGVQEGTRWQSTTPSNQNRILLKRRPHQNLIDDEIWTPWATFSTKSFFCDFIPNQKHRFGSKKRCPPRRLPNGKHRFCRCPALPGLARFCPVLPGLAIQADPDPSLFLTRRSSGRHSLAKHNSLKPESHTPQA